MNMRNTMLVLLLAAAVPARAAMEQAQLAQIRKSVEQLVQQQITGLPGRVSFALGEIDPRLNLSACPAAEAFVPTGARLWGNASVGVRCAGSNPWTIYIPVSVRIMAGVVVAAHPLTQGRAIVPGDILLQEADLGQLPGAVVTDPAQALGRTLALSVAPGQPLRQDLLRASPVVQQGQTVTLRAQGAGFKVSAAGRALGNAAEGQVAQVRTPSGHTVNGIARAGGIVEIR